MMDVNDDDEVFKLTVRAQSRRYSVVSQTRLGSEEKVELVNIPIVVVTAPQEAHTSKDTDGWENEYDNFRFRLKKTLAEREAYLQNQIERQRRGSVGSSGSGGAE